jgi:hypothetical protein
MKPKLNSMQNIIIYYVFYHGNLFPINSIDKFMSRATRTGLLSNLQARAAAQAGIFDLLVNNYVYEEFLIKKIQKN